MQKLTLMGQPTGDLLQVVQSPKCLKSTGINSAHSEDKWVWGFVCFYLKSPEVSQLLFPPVFHSVWPQPPSGASGEEPACQFGRCKRHGFGPFGWGHGTPLQYSCLENPMDRGAWWATGHGVTESDRTEVTEHSGTHWNKISSVNSDQLSLTNMVSENWASFVFCFSPLFLFIFLET